MTPFTILGAIEGPYIRAAIDRGATKYVRKEAEKFGFKLDDIDWDTFTFDDIAPSYMGEPEFNFMSRRWSVTDTTLPETDPAYWDLPTDHYGEPLKHWLRGNVLFNLKVSDKQLTVTVEVEFSGFPDS